MSVRLSIYSSVYPPEEAWCHRCGLINSLHVVLLLELLMRSASVGTYGKQQIPYA